MSTASAPSLSSLIRREAMRLGFSGIGIACVSKLPREGFFHDWLEERLHGEMRYLERQAQKRSDPRLVLAGARSLLVLAVNYYTAHEFPDEVLIGKISRYAWGNDYHIGIKYRLDKLLEFIRCRKPSAGGIGYVDTGPVMEKVWGAQTALGWMGKHTNLISRTMGSWFFIGVILLDIELDYDRPERNYCGKCNRCIKACPTGAIVAPYVLDARRCISYLTIEMRGSIPHSLRPLIGNRIFGCDDCQDVCPWNRFAATNACREFNPIKGILRPDLLSLARITSGEFKGRFESSPILRATRDGFVRNVIIAIGNSGKSHAVSVLEEALKDESQMVRAHAAWALGRIATPRARNTLESAQANGDAKPVLDEIKLALLAHRRKDAKNRTDD